MPDKLTIIRPEAKRGRKQALATVSEQQITEAEDAMKLGFPQSRVAGLLGISEAALSRAMKRDDGIGERLQRAKAQGVKNNLAARHAPRINCVVLNKIKFPVEILYTLTLAMPFKI